MKHNFIQKALAVGIFTVASSFAAAASFTFTEVAGFTDTGVGSVNVAYYQNPLDANPDAPSATVSGDMYWYNDASTPDSRLRLVNPVADSVLLAETWTTISTLYHLNNTISPLEPVSPQGWIGQEILGRLIIKDAGVQNAVVGLNDVDPITIDLRETSNTVPLANCEGGAPLGSRCDDYFSFTSIGLDPLFFQDLDGNTWKASFRLENFVNSGFGTLAGFQDKIFTREGVESSLDVQIFVEQIAEVPEPATLGILGLGLLGIGLAKRRKQNG